MHIGAYPINYTDTQQFGMYKFTLSVGFQQEAPPTYYLACVSLPRFVGYLLETLLYTSNIKLFQCTVKVFSVLPRLISHLLKSILDACNLTSHPSHIVTVIVTGITGIKAPSLQQAVICEVLGCRALSSPKRRIALIFTFTINIAMCKEYNELPWYVVPMQLHQPY